jgi:hypothetical protein
MRFRNHTSNFQQIPIRGIADAFVFPGDSNICEKKRLIDYRSTA